MNVAETLLAHAMNERTLSDTVYDAAQKLRWRIHRDPYWRPTATMPGYPDLTLVRGERLIFAELKSMKGAVSADQDGWLDALRGVGVEVYVWTPADWYSGEIERVLEGTR